MKDTFDYIVVGSGCAGAMAAQTLVESGASVAMLDVGSRNASDNLPKNKSFSYLRKHDDDQYRYLIGEQGEALHWETVGKGAQLTPPRRHMTSSVETYAPTESSTFSPVESLGYGGLGIGWGLQCWTYSPAELEAAGLDNSSMQEAYVTVAERIGISATNDEASEYTIGSVKNYQPSPTLDRNHKLIMKRYQKKHRKLHQDGFVLGRTPLALLTRDHHTRKKYSYKGLDYYDDYERSAWRPWMTIDRLKRHTNFHYFGSMLTLTFSESGSVVTVRCLDTTTNQPKDFQAKKLILAASALGSARIVLRSMGSPKTTLPLLCNPYTYVPCLQPQLVGKGQETKKLGLAQLSLFFDETGTNYDISVASLYSYESLMLFRLTKELPLNFADGRKLAQYLSSGLVIMGIHHPDHPSQQKAIELVKRKGNPTGDILKITYQLSSTELEEIDRREKKFTSAMRSLHTFPIKRINPGYGSSIHYAGTLPFSQTDRPFTLQSGGRLNGTSSVYVADSAGFNYLPARGLTFTLMANAHVTAQKALNDAAT